MNSKPTFKTKVKEKVKRAKRELEQEDKPLKMFVRTTISMDVNLLCAVKQLAIKRKRAGKKPDTVTGIIQEALAKIIKT